MSKFTRRQLIQAGLATGAFFTAKGCSNSGSQSASSGPTVNTNKIKDVTLRFIGTGVSQINEVKQKAEEDLGFKIEMTPLSTDENNKKAITQPKQWDIFDGEYFSLPLGDSLRKPSGH